MSVSGYPTIPRFLPRPQAFIVQYEQHVVKNGEKWGWGGWKYGS